MICYIMFILLYSYVFIVNRYMRLKFKRSKCGNTHIQSNISACEEIVYIFLCRHSCKKTRLNFKQISHSLYLTLCIQSVCVYHVSAIRVVCSIISNRYLFNTIKTFREKISI